MPDPKPPRKKLPAYALIPGALLAVFIASGAVSFWYGARSERLLRASLEQNISLLAKLPDLRAGVREIDGLTELYLETGETGLLESRRQAIAALMRLYGDVRSLSAAQPAQDVLLRFERELKLLLDLQQRLVRARRLSGPERAALRGRRDAVLETVSAFGDRSALKLQIEAFRVQRTSGRLYAARFALETLIALLAAFYIYFCILRPLGVVERIASAWELGAAWPVQTLSSIPEIRVLITRFGEMATRLNGEFAKVRQFSQFKTRLVSVVSHEFGNALAVIQAAVFLLREHLPPAWLKENEHLLAMISTNVTGLSTATHNLLDMGRHEAGQLAVDFKPTDGARLLFDVMRRLQLLYEKNNLHVSLELPDGLKPLWADPAALALIVSNLLSNAIKYTPSGGRIVLGILPEASNPEKVRLFVRDTGIGLSRDEAANILGGPGYYRTDGGKAMTARGYGIGLSLTKLMIEAHGSALELESAPGQGSRFSFLLPVRGPTPPAL